MTQLSVTALIAGIIGVLIAAITLWDTRRGTSARHRRSAAEQLINEILNAKLTSITAELASIEHRLTGLETKIEPFWQLLAVNMARILHSPLPGRERMDRLLERFMAGTITPAERTELMGNLRQIRDHEPGSPTPFPVYPGEQTAAGILLTTLELMNA